MEVLHAAVKGRARGQLHHEKVGGGETSFT